MLKETAGNNAGKIWRALNESPEKSLKQVKRSLKFTDKDLYLGLGWLLREDKISLSEKDGEIYPTLKD